MAKENSSDRDSDDLPKAFASIVIVDENEEADMAKFSAYLWITNSGATIHIGVQWNAFSEYTKLPKKEIQELGNKLVTTHGHGIIAIKGKINRHTVQIWLKNTLHVPEAQENLILLGCIDSVDGQAICTNGKIHMYLQFKQIHYSNRHTKTQPILCIWMSTQSNQRNKPILSLRSRINILGWNGTAISDI